MLWKTDVLASRLSSLVADVRASIESINGKERVNPFLDMYRLVSTLTARMIGLDELAENSKLRGQLVHYIDLFDRSSTPLSAMFPLVPWPAKFKRMYLRGLQTLYDALWAREEATADGRMAGSSEKHLLSKADGMGDGVSEIVYFVIAVLWAGQQKSESISR